MPGKQGDGVVSALVLQPSDSSCSGTRLPFASIHEGDISVGISWI